MMHHENLQGFPHHRNIHPHHLNFHMSTNHLPILKLYQSQIHLLKQLQTVLSQKFFQTLMKGLQRFSITKDESN